MQAVLKTPTENLTSQQDLLQDPLFSQTYGHIMQIMKQKGTQEDKSLAIKNILVEAFHDAQEALNNEDFYASELKNADEKNQQLAEKIDTIVKEHTVLENKFKKLNHKSAELKRQYALLEQKHCKTEQNHQDLAQETSKLKKEYAALDRQRHQLELQYQDLHNEKDELKTKSDSLEQDYAVLAKENSNLGKRNELLKKSVEVLNKKYSNLKSGYDVLDKQMQVQHSNFNHLNQEYSQVQVLLNLMVETNSKMQADLDAQMKRTNELNEKLDTVYHGFSVVGRQILHAFVPEHVRKICSYAMKVYNNQSQNLS